jgi:dihydroorotase
MVVFPCLYGYTEKVSTMEGVPSLVLRNVRLPGGRIADVTIIQGIVHHIGAGIPADRVIDCSDLFVLPAAIDMHVHMRGGQQSAKEDWESGSKSALAGGVTVVVDQPNTIPPVTTPDNLRARVLDARTHSLCHFAINSGVTRDTPIHAMWRAGAMAFGEVFYAPSSYGEAVTRQELGLALASLQPLGALATIHAEEVIPGSDTSLDTHGQIRAPEGELRAVREVLSANTTRCRLHFCHLSTGPSVDAAKGSVEATPHHLLLSREMFGNEDTSGKVNPPLRSERERKEIFSRWKRIDVIASDHAPHTRMEKNLPFSNAPSGVPGVETMVPLLLAAVLKKTLSLPDVIARTSSNPAALLGIPPAGFAQGCRGDFALYPKESTLIDPERLHSRCGWTPFEGHEGVFPVQVIMDGMVVYENGEFFRANPKWIPGKGYSPP